MTVKNLLEKGYFPKELPPAFTTEIFGLKSVSINRKWQNLLTRKRLTQPGESGKDAERRFRTDYVIKYGSSAILNYSLAKGIHSRRQLGIPNPKQYHDLCIVITKHWSLLNRTLKKQSFSASTPVEADAIRSVRTKSRTFNEFKFWLLEKSLNKRFELRIDINQFYPSIYTHSITWAIMGRDAAKKYFKEKNKSPQHWQTLLNTDAEAGKYALCEQLDTLVRNCQERQSVGLPIGPDTSFILAEIVGSGLDFEIAGVLSSIDYEAIRYYDDYYFYGDSYGDIEKILRAAESIFNSYSLELSEEKVKINEIPFVFEPSWVPILSTFRFSSGNKHEMLSFFSIVFDLIRKNPKESNLIVSHGLRRFEYGNILIPTDCWDTFLALLIETMLADPSNLDKFLKIILSYPHHLTTKAKTKIGVMAQAIINSNIGLNHTFEVSWSMWILKALLIKVESGFLSLILRNADTFSKLICLDLIDSGLYKGKKPSLNKITKSINESDLFSDQWLFAYEAIKKGWLTPSKDIFSSHEYFKILSDSNVEFYDSSIEVHLEFISGPYNFAEN